MPNNKKNPNTKPHIPSIEETNARIAKEFAEQDPKAEDSLRKRSDSNVIETSMQSSSSVAEQAGEIVSDDTAMGSAGQPLHESKGTGFPADSHETDENVRKLLMRHLRDSDKRIENPPLLLDDLKGLGMFGKLSDDQRHVTMPFEDVHRLVTTMRMAEVILNERIQNKRKTKLDLIKAQLNADNCPNMAALLVELEKAKVAVTQKHSFQSVEAFGDEPVTDIEGIILFETLLIARAVYWLAMLSINPDSEIRRGTFSVFSELQAAYSTQKSLHELYFHQYRVR
jgi:hypothetical protein